MRRAFLFIFILLLSWTIGGCDWFESNSPTEPGEFILVAAWVTLENTNEPIVNLPITLIVPGDQIRTQTKSDGWTDEETLRVRNGIDPDELQEINAVIHGGTTWGVVEGVWPITDEWFPREQKFVKTAKIKLRPIG